MDRKTYREAPKELMIWNITVSHDRGDLLFGMGIYAYLLTADRSSRVQGYTL